MQERIEQVQAGVRMATVERDAIQRTHEMAATRADAADTAVRAGDVALSVLHAVGDVTSARVQQTIAELCSEGLRLVFDDPSIRLEVRPVERRGVIEADLVLVRGKVETDPLSGNGGGLIADAAAMLRLVLVRLMASRGLAPLLVLDEPFAALSKGHREAMATTLHEVAASMDIQVITVTHADEFALGTVYQLTWADRDALLAEVTLIGGDDV
tara:strand:- start:9597 stop:10235 length:639 start_codon:yes stop_codon:yes gene_type:complete